MIENEELLSIVPHRGKMMLLSRVTGYDLKERTIEAEYHVTKGCLFYDSAVDGVPSWVCFEFIAQAIGALSGIMSRVKGEPPKMGFILSVSQVRMEMPIIKTGNIVTIKAKEIENMDLLYVFTGEVFLEGRKIFEGKLTVIDVGDEQVKTIQKENDSGE